VWDSVCSSDVIYFQQFNATSPRPATETSGSPGGDCRTSAGLAACGGGSSSTTPVVPAPAISNFTPTSGSAGAVVTITGANLNGPVRSRSAGKRRRRSGQQRHADHRHGGEQHDHRRGHGDYAVGTAASAGMFTVLAPPVISSFARRAAGRTSVVITGTVYRRHRSGLQRQGCFGFYGQQRDEDYRNGRERTTTGLVP